MQQTARILGKDDDAEKYGALLAKIKEAFRQEFVTENGRLASNTQTAYVLALMFDLLPEDQRPEAARRLAADVRKRGDHLSTGFVGASYLCPVLSRFGYLDVAYDLLNQDTYPSWLYPVKQGATTIWERWDGIKPDGDFQDAGMNSFNHYAYGAIGEWLYQVVAGLEVDPEAPGYKHSLIQPQPGGGLTSVRATLNSMYGQVVSAWELAEERFKLAVTVPANTRATVRLPAASLEQVTESGGALPNTAGIERAYQDGDDVVVEVGSGQFEFAYSSDRFKGLEKPRKLSIHTPLQTLLESEGAKAVLAKYLPDLSDSPMLSQAMGFSLVQISTFIPHLLTDEVLQALDKELAQL